MKNIYFYPQFDYEKEASPNPYIKDFQKSMEGNFHIINRKENHKGVLDFFKYIVHTDIYILNWIEDLPIYTLGKLQMLFFLFFLFMARIFKKKIVWILHNKYSHFIAKNHWTDFMYKILMKYSDLIVTHSSDGILFVSEFYPEQVSKVRYINHPMRKNPEKIKESKSLKKYDFLIWGTIEPYKGVLEFLKFLNDSEEGKKVNLLIAGKCFISSYKNEMIPYLNENITFKDHFFSLEEIRKMADQADFILFTHKTFSVLSSGALMDTLSMGVKIIGPENGSFKDISSLSFLKTFKEYEDILSINRTGKKDNVNFEELSSFYSENTWKVFGEKLNVQLQDLF